MIRFKKLLHPRISIRTKLFIIVIFFAVLPWFGYRYLWEIDNYLKLSQQHSLTSTSQAVATALHQRPTLFSQLNRNLVQQREKDFYNYSLKQAVFEGSIDKLLLTGKDKFKYFSSSFITYKTKTVKKEDYAINAMIGNFDTDSYLVLSVKTPSISTQAKGSFRFDVGDHLIIATTDKNENLKRFIVSINQNKSLNLALLPTNPAMIVPQTLQSDYQGFWRETPIGFDLVLSIPSKELGDKFSFSAYFANKNNPTESNAVLASSPINSVHNLGNLNKPSETIESVVNALSYTEARIWVLNSVGQVLASGGSIHDAQNSWNTATNIKKSENYLSAMLAPLFRLFEQNTDTNFVDPFNNATHIDSPIVNRAMSGFTISEKYYTPDNKAEILASATPIWQQNNVVGVVIAEQSTMGIRALRNNAMQSLLNTVFIVLLLASAAIILFASNISNRITRLRNDAKDAVDHKGKFNDFTYQSQTQDEIGDLGRSFQEVLQQLGQYNLYLEKMSSRLGHELRTPITVVRSSLEHIQLTGSNPQADKYIVRAQEGLKRLSLILNSMTEASRIESSLQNENREVFNLSEVVNGLVEGYQLGFPDSLFTLTNNTKVVYVDGVPEYFAQLLDKLISNAIDFSTSRRPIEISVTQDSDAVIVSVTNEGPKLPLGMENEIFSSLISIRENNSNSPPHLGFGLYIAKLIAEFHNGSISAKNRTDVDGVLVTVLFPKYRES
ncbi:proteobacterial dedicated sortase system histidine kinase [Shewanella sp. 202IG2-18]|uniref:proteobacterial dedicated sortase system histidine kinase n=1 Tax=Parashewanella hymeniacidonis TaxID=2807618 RepID=UPI00195F759D|nr:proteobacterial dedicated sortase system histidine kinase [Parashewanella hymeniacidonis]MBM7070854.1 proteobacterial dedicated sortase system histidine kinase [Parashewanella hymeniacidonis]